tara:strand:+ start:112 stop:309 length:198 start_codon:yes stop_codon:yes gene_type:complete
MVHPVARHLYHGFPSPLSTAWNRAAVDVSAGSSVMYLSGSSVDPEGVEKDGVGGECIVKVYTYEY